VLRSKLMGKVCSTLTGRTNLQDLAPIVNQVAAALTGGAIGSRDVVEPVKLTGKRRSLFIGCNYTGSQNELHGCINDVKRMMPVVEKLGFPGDEGHRRVLLDDEGWPADRRPTKANIVKAMQWLVEGVQTGDALFLHYSGHGGREPAKNPTESCQYHESLVPLDFQEAGLLVDTELFDLLVKPLPTGARLTCILDSCHSAGALDLPFIFVGNQGDLKKGMAGEAISMFMSMKWKEHLAKAAEGDPSLICKDIASMGMGLWNLKARLDGAADADENGYKTDVSANKGLQVGEVLAITGCRSDQTSADVQNVQQQFHLDSLEGGSGRAILVDRVKQRSGTASGKEAGGALTSAFLEAMLEEAQQHGSRSLPGTPPVPAASAQQQQQTTPPATSSSQPLTYFSLLEKIRRKLSSEGYSQVPQAASSLVVDMRQPFALDTVFVPCPPSHTVEHLGQGAAGQPHSSGSAADFLAALAGGAGPQAAQPSAADVGAGGPAAPPSSTGALPAGGVSAFLAALAQNPQGFSMLQQHPAAQQQPQPAFAAPTAAAAA